MTGASPALLHLKEEKMSGTEDKKTSSENTDVPTQAVNPAMLVKAPKLPIKVEFSQDGSKKEQHNDKK